MLAIFISLYFAEPPPPPDMISAAVTPRNSHNIQEEIIFIWEGIEYNCPSLQYDFTSTNCGNCVLIAPTEVNCSSFTKSTVEVSCNFSVRTKICGNIIGEAVTTTINLKGTCSIHTSSLHTLYS